MNNYESAFLSWCTENLGVVPLMTLVAFLLCPLFFNLLALLFFVTLVLETIFKLHLYLFLKFAKDLLSHHALGVKIFLSTIVISATYATPTVRNTPNHKQNIILSIGEHKEISLKAISKYTIGNKNIIAVTSLQHRNSLLIKGKQKGFSEILIWKKNNSKERLNIYVLQKNKRHKILQMISAFKELNLKSQFQGPKIKVSGKIQSAENYYYFHQTITESEVDIIYQQAKLANDLARILIAEVYYHLFAEGIESFKCRPEAFNISCHYLRSDAPSLDLKKYLEKKYFVKFHNSTSKDTNTNYILNLKLLQFDNLTNSSMALGLENLQGNISDLFSSKVNHFWNKNQYFLGQQDISLATLAAPKILLRLGIKAKIQLGTEVPFNQKIKDQVHTKWKFSGIRLDLILQKKGYNYFLKYKTEFTKGSSGHNISGGKQSSSLKITPGEPIQLFQISLINEKNDSSGIPFLKQLPLLGNLFSTSKDQVSYKKIIGIIQLEEYGNDKQYTKDL